MSDYLTDFVQESEERITELNNALLTLERDPDDEEAMENIFRIAHTLKGNCGAMGLESASDLAHAIEDLLDAVRSDDLEVTPELMDVIFEAVDVLEAMIDEVAVDGEIETDPSATIDALRSHLADATKAKDAEREVAAASGITTPTSDEIDDVCARFEPPADDGHDVYLVRLEIAEREGVNNGKLVVDALIDAFDLMGTDPPRETIDADDYGNRFDAVFATAVGEAAITSGLEPVEEVEEFEIVDVSDRFDPDQMEANAAQSAADAEPGDDISPDEAKDLEVDDLLAEFDEFDDLDEMVEEVDDEELEAFEDMGEAGSFDDLLEESDVADPDAEPSADPVEGDRADASETPGGDAADEPAEDDEVEDAGAVFNELKEEVEMVGFDELQDELAELEFDEFDDEEEVDMDELLGDDAADDSFLDGDEPAESEVDDILVDSEPADAGEPADESGVTADDSVDTDESAAADVADAGAADDLPAEPASTEPASQPDPDDSPADASAGEGAETSELEDNAVEAPEDEVVGDETAVVDVADDDTVGAEDDEAVADDDTVAVEDDVIDDDTVAVEGDVVDDDTVAVEGDAADDESMDAGSVPTDDAGSVPTDDGDAGGTDAPAETDSFDDGVDTAADVASDFNDSSGTVDHEAGDEAVETADDPDEFGDGTESTDDESDDAPDDSFGTDVEDEFDPTASFDDDFEASADETDPFDDDFGVAADDSLEGLDAEPTDTDPDGDDFEVEFDDPLDVQSDEGAFAGTTEFDTADAGFDSPGGGSETDGDSGPASAGSFGDDAADSADDDESDVVRIVDEPEMEIPDIEVPETPSDRPDADAETDEIQSVRVDVEQIDSLLTLVEGLVTSRVRLRHAAESADEGSALDTELDALSDLTTDLQETVMDIRLVPLRTVTNRLPRVVRDIAREQDKEVAFEMTGEDIELDRSILDRIGDPLIHLVRNAVDHGIEQPERREDADKPREGTVEVHAERARDRVTITVDDDGNGLDPDRLRSEAVEADIVDESEADAMSDEDAYDLIFHPGLSTADEVTDVSGRGVGMDVVKRTIEDLDGTVSIESSQGVGTTVTMELPVTVAIDEILFVESGGEEFGVPTKAVQDIESAGAIQTADGESVLPGEDRDYPVIPLADVFETPAPGANGDGMVVRIRDDVREVALHCDIVHGQQEVVVKPFEGFMSGIPGLSGATVRGRGEVVNILDVTTL